MFDSYDAADNFRCGGDVITVTAETAEPQQDQQDCQEEEAR